MSDLSPTTQLAILLTAKWVVNGAKPLTNTEYDAVRRWVGAGPNATSELLSGQRSISDSPIDPVRLSSLLSRGMGVFQSLDRWMQAGLWVRSWSDRDYPSRFKQLKVRAPALIFGYGNPEAFTDRALAIVGSRNASTERVDFTAQIARACAREKITVVSGGARGVDSTAMLAGINAGGTVVGVLAESLLKEAGKKAYRHAILENRLCLMSEVNPEARFDVGNAMSRNRLAYACADAALVIECDPGKGGTWQGAMEARREGKAVYVLKGARAERELHSLGAFVIDLQAALSPSKLIEPGVAQPDNDQLPTVSDWLRDVVTSTERNEQALACYLRDEANTIAGQLIQIAYRDGLVVKPAEVTTALQTDPPLSAETRKRRRSRQRANSPANTVLAFDSLDPLQDSKPA